MMFNDKIFCVSGLKYVVYEITRFKHASCISFSVKFPGHRVTAFICPSDKSMTYGSNLRFIAARSDKGDLLRVAEKLNALAISIIIFAERWGEKKLRTHRNR